MNRWLLRLAEMRADVQNVQNVQNPSSHLLLNVLNVLNGHRVLKEENQGTGHILAFPILKSALVNEIAVNMKRKRSSKAAERYLAKQMCRVAKEMNARGIPSATVKREVRALEPAVRGALWRLISRAEATVARTVQTSGRVTTSPAIESRG
jgi:hypothetical protein